MSLENAIRDAIHRVGMNFVRKKIMYKFVYGKDRAQYKVRTVARMVKTVDTEDLKSFA